ncbi:MAG: formylglycine-generating enzyme family protein [Treponema sp.]|jgi:formylglycine-generating enzyme required for sulfatase activity/TolB-like protein|nr:formylglycine-generating enzyme family protein [Treponema sp.]
MKRILLTAVLTVIGSLAFTQEKIAVFPFEDKDNLLTNTESFFFYRQFTNEFTNKNAKRFTIVPRQDVEKLFSAEEKFQLSDLSAKAKTAETQRVLNGTQILSGAIGKVNNRITISVSLYTFPEFAQLPGGVDKRVANKDALFDIIPELVQDMQNAIARGGVIPELNKLTSLSQTAIPQNFVRIEGGTFTMGSPSSEPERDSNELQHTVTVSGFYMGKYEVTQADYEAVMGTNPSNFKGSNLPVENVSWYDAVEYCNKLSQKEELTPAYTIDKSRSDPNNKNHNDNVRWLVTWNQNANGYRLPTEAEWEYACRAGTTTPFNTGNNITTSNANYSGIPYNKNAKGIFLGKTTPVGSFAPNPWGLYDMHGNVYEWCWDWYGDYSNSSQTDPKGIYTGSFRVARGGCWSHNGVHLRSAYRYNHGPYNRQGIGFRLARSNF